MTAIQAEGQFASRDQKLDQISANGAEEWPRGCCTVAVLFGAGSRFMRDFEFGFGSGVLSRLTADSSVPVDTRHSHYFYRRGAVPLACSLRTSPVLVRATVFSNSLPTQNCSRPSVTSTSQELPA